MNIQNTTEPGKNKSLSFIKPIPPINAHRHKESSMTQRAPQFLENNLVGSEWTETPGSPHVSGCVGYS